MVVWNWYWIGSGLVQSWYNVGIGSFVIGRSWYDHVMGWYGVGSMGYRVVGFLLVGLGMMLELGWFGIDGSWYWVGMGHWYRLAWVGMGLMGLCRA